MLNTIQWWKLRHRYIQYFFPHLPNKMLKIEVPLTFPVAAPTEPDALACQRRFIYQSCICFPAELIGAAVIPLLPLSSLL